MRMTRKDLLRVKAKTEEKSPARGKKSHQTTAVARNEEEERRPTRPSHLRKRRRVVGARLSRPRRRRRRRIRPGKRTARRIEGASPSLGRGHGHGLGLGLPRRRLLQEGTRGLLVGGTVRTRKRRGREGLGLHHLLHLHLLLLLERTRLHRLVGKTRRLLHERTPLQLVTIRQLAVRKGTLLVKRNPLAPLKRRATTKMRAERRKRRRKAMRRRRRRRSILSRCRFQQTLIIACRQKRLRRSSIVPLRWHNTRKDEHRKSRPRTTTKTTARNRNRSRRLLRGVGWENLLSHLFDPRPQSRVVTPQKPPHHSKPLLAEPNPPLSHSRD
mmetsp:Transcript_23865/g.39969  ORF Transcript_23865/g.39969 Transcript_23865/m.39969 type:complete len:327 (+) Transcript_23865:2251-3231(+)